MSTFFYISQLAIRLDNGKTKTLPYSYAYEFSEGSNFTIVGIKDCQGAINRVGEEIIAVKYPNLEKLLLKNYKNIIDVIDSRVVIGETNGKYGASDLEKMEIIFELEYDAKEILEKIDKYEP